MRTKNGNFLIGVHTGGSPSGANYGTVFYDDKGLGDVYGYEVLKEFMGTIAPYEPKTVKGRYKY